MKKAVRVQFEVHCYLLPQLHWSTQRVYHAAGVFCLVPWELQIICMHGGGLPGAVMGEVRNHSLEQSIGWRKERKFLCQTWSFWVSPDIQSFNAFPGDITWVLCTAWEDRFCALCYGVSRRSRNGTRRQEIRAQHSRGGEGSSWDTYKLSPEGRTVWICVEMM